MKLNLILITQDVYIDPFELIAINRVLISEFSSDRIPILLTKSGTELVFKNAKSLTILDIAPKEVIQIILKTVGAYGYNEAP